MTASAGGGSWNRNEKPSPNVNLIRGTPKAAQLVLVSGSSVFVYERCNRNTKLDDGDGTRNGKRVGLNLSFIWPFAVPRLPEYTPSAV